MKRKFNITLLVGLLSLILIVTGAYASGGKSTPSVYKPTFIGTGAAPYQTGEYAPFVPLPANPAGVSFQTTETPIPTYGSAGTFTPSGEAPYYYEPIKGIENPGSFAPLGPCPSGVDPKYAGPYIYGQLLPGFQTTEMNPFNQKPSKEIIRQTYPVPQRRSASSATDGWNGFWHGLKARMTGQ
ncbi:MAG: hypothetical protein NTW14_01210 [bacterium]|nr:hypothetical protein [bacterium]